MANELAVHSDINLDELQRTATMLVASGYFDAKGDSRTQVAQIATKILAGRELGYGPFASVQGIHVIQGKPQISANLMAAAVKNHPRYDYRVRQMEDSAVAVEFFENGDSLGISTFTLEDAKRAGTQNTQKFPRNMLFARALSNGVRWYCPDVFYGNAVYVEGELEDTPQPTLQRTVNQDTGEIVDGHYTEAPATQNGNGNGHKAESPELPMTDPISKVQTSALHAVGKELYGAEWDAKRHAIVEWKTNGRTSSSKEITAAEADALITGLRKKLAEAAAAAQTAPETEDNPFEEVPA